MYSQIGVAKGTEIRRNKVSPLTDIRAEESALMQDSSLMMNLNPLRRNSLSPPEAH